MAPQRPVPDVPLAAAVTVVPKAVRLADDARAARTVPVLVTALAYGCPRPGEGVSGCRGARTPWAAVPPRGKSQKPRSGSPGTRAPHRRPAPRGAGPVPATAASGLVSPPTVECFQPRDPPLRLGAGLRLVG